MRALKAIGLIGISLLASATSHASIFGFAWVEDIHNITVTGSSVAPGLDVVYSGYASCADQTYLATSIPGMVEVGTGFEMPIGHMLINRVSMGVITPKDCWFRATTENEVRTQLTLHVISLWDALRSAVIKTYPGVPKDHLNQRVDKIVGSFAKDDFVLEFDAQLMGTHDSDIVNLAKISAEQLKQRGTHIALKHFTRISDVEVCSPAPAVAAAGIDLSGYKADPKTGLLFKHNITGYIDDDGVEYTFANEEEKREYLKRHHQ